MDQITKKAGRILFAIPMGIFGFFHFIFASQMAGAVPSYIPGGIFWIYFTGICLVAACVSVVVEKMAKLALQLLALLILIFILTLHLPGFLAGGPMAQMSLMNGLKDLAMLGAALGLSIDLE